jgi:glycosyltransferase involved in cell wall biosynthesis
MTAKNLTTYQNKMGIESRIISNIDSTIFHQPFNYPLLTFSSLADQFIVKKRNNKNMFSLFRPKSKISTGDFSKHKNSILHLHWVTELNLLDKLIHNDIKLVWTMHDLWAFTGGCHHSNDCLNFNLLCQKCPQVNKIFRGEVVSQKLLKSKLFSISKNLSIVFPSVWLKNKVQTLLPPNIRSYVIKNPIDNLVFCKLSKDKSKDKYNIKDTYDLIFGVSASNLSDPNKNIIETVRTLKSIAILLNKSVLILIAGSNPPLNLKYLSDVKYLGRLKNQELPFFYNCLDYFVSFSHNENLPYNIIEAQSCGVPVISNFIGGIPEIVLNRKTGLLYKNLIDFKINFNDLETYGPSNFTTNALNHIGENFAQHIIYESYLKVYKDLGFVY